MRRRLLAVAIVLLAALGVAAWRVASSRDDAVETVGAAAAANPPNALKSESNSAPTELARPPQLARPTEHADTRESAALGDPAALRANAAPSYDASKFTLVRVVDALSGEAIEHAEVRVIDDPARDGASGDLPQVCALLAKVSKPLKSGPDGRVLAPHHYQRILVSARAGERFGVAAIEPDFEEHVLALCTDADLIVRAVDASGVALGGARLSFGPERLESRAHPRAKPPKRARAWLGRFEATSRASDGRAEFPHALWWLSQDSHAQFSVSANGLFRERPRAFVSRDSLGPTPISIVLPDTGFVELRVRDLDGVEAGSRATVTLTLAHSDSLTDSTQNGAHTFDSIEVGDEFDAAAVLDGDLGPLEAHIVGPKARGERAIAELNFATSCASLVGRALDADGAPVASGAIEVQVDARPRGAGAHVPSRVATRSDGTFRLPLPGWPLGESGRLRFVFTPVGAPGLITALVDVPPRLALGENAIGDVVLRQLPTLARGRVVDELGAPVLDAIVEAVAVDGRSPGKRYRAASRPDGEFWIMAELDANQITLTAQHKEFIPMPGRVEPRGVEDALLTLEHAGSFESVVLYDPSLQLAEYNATWIVENDNPKQSVRASYFFQPTAEPGVARFTAKGVAPGVGRLELRAVSTLFRSLDGVRVRPGEPCDDRRVTELDLRGAIQAFNLSIVDSNGQAVSRGDVLFRASGAGDSYSNWPYTRGRARVLAPFSALDLWVTGDHCRALQIDGVRGDRTITLPAPLEVELALSDPPILPDGVVLTASLDPLRADGVRARGAAQSRTTNFDARGRASVRIDEPGRYRIALTLVLRRKGSSARAPLPKAEHPILEVHDQSGVQSFTLDLARAPIESAAAQLGAH